MDERVKVKICHAVSIALLVVSLAFSLFRFSPVALRVWQAVKDFALSFAQLVLSYAKLETLVPSTVNTIPSGMENVLPITLDEFKLFLNNYWQAFKSGDNVKAYFFYLASGSLGVLFAISSLVLPLLILALVVWLSYRKVDTEHGKNTTPLRVWFKIEGVAFYPVKRALSAYFRFLLDEEAKKRRRYIIAFALVWAWNLNFLTIALEAVAFIMYLSVHFDYLNVFVQVAKLAADLSVSTSFLPPWAWVIIGYIVFNAIRRKIGFDRLDADEEKNEEFLEEHPGNLIATGPPRVGKTQAITDMTLSQNVIFRKKAKEKSRERMMEFPFFSWSILEQSVLEMRRRIPTFDLTYIREWIATMASHFKGRAIYKPEENEFVLRLSKALGYKGDDFIFNYNYKRYGLTYDNNLTEVDLFHCIELYAEEFYIYTSPTPLIIGNYPMRTNIRWKDYGNFPLMKVNFFKEKARDVKKKSQWSHIMPQDSFRLGKQKNPWGAYNNSFDLGCLTMSELGKELGNQITNRGEKKKADADGCNPNNDLWTMNAKMFSHATTIDYYTYFRILADEQRAMSILADFRELGSEMKIESKKAPVIKMPCFAFEELLYVTAKELMSSVFDFFKSRHGKNTLFFYFALRGYSLIHNHYVRVFNQFSSYQINLKIADTSKDEKVKEGKTCKYYISRKKSQSDVYNTAFFGTFYRERFKRSETGGINQIPQFTGLEKTIPQMLFEESHFNGTVFESFFKNAA